MFHIEDDWYLVPDQYSWNLARKSKTPSPKFMWAEITYHNTQAEALIYYMEQKQREAAGNARDGELADLIDILSAEQKRLVPVLRTAFKKVCDIPLLGGETEGEDFRTFLTESTGDRQRANHVGTV